MSIDAPKSMPVPPTIPPEILGEVVQEVMEELKLPPAPAESSPLSEPVIPTEANEELVARHPDYDDWVDLKKADEETLNKIRHPADSLMHVPAIEVREGGSIPEGIAGNDWHEAVEEPTTQARPSVEPDADAPAEK